MITNDFVSRHNGPSPSEADTMLKAISANSLDQLIDETIPPAIRLNQPMPLPQGLNEYEYLQHLRTLASSNRVMRSFIGQGYYECITPAVIQRNVFENPGWYTSYTPYQAEISQGRLEALLIYQTVIADLTAMPLANASLLDEGTAAAEAMIMLYNARSREAIKAGANRFVVVGHVFPQTLAVIRTRAKYLGIEVVTTDADKLEFTGNDFAFMAQYPDAWGRVEDYSQLVAKAHGLGIASVIAADLLSLALLTPPGEWGADVVVGSSQRFGVPMGYGGPHAGFFATRESFKRFMPGRIIGVSVDAQGHRALRMALQTREQHIKRERATSNICTAQALLAMMSGFYAVYHGSEGIRAIARHINILTAVLAQELEKLGYARLNDNFFDTLTYRLPEGVKMDDIRRAMLNAQFNLHYEGDSQFSIHVGETVTLAEINTLLEILAKCNRKGFTLFVCDPAVCSKLRTFPSHFDRQSAYLQEEVFKRYRNETDMMRFLKKLENRDLALNRSMIPLGSCTMKLNAAAELIPLSWPEWANIHPFAPADQAKGYHQLISNLEKDLCTITGFSAISFQPNSGASGEYAGLLVIRAYHESRGQGHRNICLIPSSAHGTNPASAAMAGMEVVVVKSDEMGNIDLTDLSEKAEKHSEGLAAIMVTYPSTHGVFEEGIFQLVEIVHRHGGQVYMDGANMNAQVGLTSPGHIGADVCHLNLHKTFAIPHGGGGPGVGPIGVASHLAPFLPGHPLQPDTPSSAIGAVSSAPFGSAYVLPISYGYIKMLGGTGLTEATRYAILTANYLKTKLENDFKIFYTGTHGRVAHELILDCNQFLKTADIAAIDIAKRLMDYGFHAPTVAFPVIGTLMVEATESEPMGELDRFVAAMLDIRRDIAAIEAGTADKANNVIKNAPHTVAMATSAEWNYPYSRQHACFPLEMEAADKYWPSVTRIDDAFGDRNLMCTCAPVESYQSNG